MRPGTGPVPYGTVPYRPVTNTGPGITLVVLASQSQKRK